MFSKICLTFVPLTIHLAGAHPRWGLQHTTSNPVLELSESPHYAPTVHTSIGTIIGIYNASYPNVEEFLGIPYATPPLGDLRFMPPQTYRATGPDQIINATRNPPACWQNPTNPSTTIFTEDAPFFGSLGSQSEDCLQINIYRPKDNGSSSCYENDTKLPVLIFVYGGASQSGSVNEIDEYPPPWIQRTQNLIVAKIQYRVNIFGFPVAGGLTNSQQNAGYLDQRLGIEWIRDNIEAFGGDVNKITLAGYSAGATAVSAYNFAYPDDPIANAFISMSSNSLTPSAFSYDFSHSNFSSVAKHFHCTGGDEAVLACLQQTDAEAIANYISDKPQSQDLHFKPIPNGETVVWNYTASALAGNVSGKFIMYGSNADEGTRLVDTSTSTAPPNQTDVDLVTWFGIMCPEVDQVHQLVRSSKAPPIYRYFYRGNFSNISPLPWMGAYHGSILPVLFGTSDFFPTQAPNKAFENATRDYLQDTFVDYMNEPASLQSKGWPLNRGGWSNATGQDAVNYIGNPEGQVTRIVNGAWNESICSTYPLINGTEGVAGSFSGE